MTALSPCPEFSPDRVGCGASAREKTSAQLIVIAHARAFLVQVDHYDLFVSRVVIPWQEVTPLELSNGELHSLLANVDVYRTAWEDFVSKVTPEEFAEARRRSLRRHAIETGIIERLYDVSWGVTEALVVEGLTLEVAEREGGIDDDAYENIKAQFGALEFLADVAREGQDLSIGFVRDLHKLITRHQSTYDARDAEGRPITLPLNHGDWKQQPNHVERADGSRLEYAPPIEVQRQMQRLLDLYGMTPTEAHPLVVAAWLHHQFIRIHPFADGNGRVARALVLLVLLRSRYAPLVVDGVGREEYIAALEAANGGDLRVLVRLFARLEIVALLSELERPTRSSVGDSPVDVARRSVEQLREIKIGTDQARAAAVEALAVETQGRLVGQLERLGADLRATFSEFDPSAYEKVSSAAPPHEHARWFYTQLVRTARTAGFFANLAEGSWWVRLKLQVSRQDLWFVVAVQKVGHGETGVLAITVFAEFVPPRDDRDDEARPVPTPLFSSASGDHVTLNLIDQIDDKWPEICELVERTLAASVAAFASRLG